MALSLSSSLLLRRWQRDCGRVQPLRDSVPCGGSLATVTTRSRRRYCQRTARETAVTVTTASVILYTYAIIAWSYAPAAVCNNDTATTFLRHCTRTDLHNASHGHVSVTRKSRRRRVEEEGENAKVTMRRRRKRRRVIA